jgi:ribosomal protein L7/L12
MRINLKRLTDAVPELMELEFIAEDTAILISTTITIKQAEDLYVSLRKALQAHWADNPANPAAGATCAMPPENSYGIPDACYKKVVEYIHGGFFIDAIKQVRTDTNMGLKDAKDLAETIREDMKMRGEIV